MVDFVKAKPGHYDDYLESLRLNWFPPRVEAEKQRFIKSYKLLVLPPSSESRYDYILMTEFSTLQTFDEREANFDKVFGKLGKPTLIRGLKPRELADIVESQNVTENVLGR
jgi:hypothetical protein